MVAVRNIHRSVIDAPVGLLYQGQGQKYTQSGWHPSANWGNKFAPVSNWLSKYWLACLSVLFILWLYYHHQRSSNYKELLISASSFFQYVSHVALEVTNDGNGW